MNSLQKFIAVVVPLLFTQSGFAVSKTGKDSCNQTPEKPCFEQGYPTNSTCTPPAYNQAAGIDLQCGNDFFATASFIYWEAMQDGLDLAFSSSANVTGTTLTLAFQPVDSQILVQNFEYKPGFKVGLGWTDQSDGWVILGEYTRFHSETHTSANPPAPPPGVGSTGIWLLGVDWYLSVANGNVTSTGPIDSDWKCHLDLADLRLSRPFYSGTHLTFEPFLGVRGAWIAQSLHIAFYNVLGTGGAGASPNNPVVSHNRSHSWAVGPRLGANSSWLFGYGLRMMGDASASLLYTRYTKVSMSVDRSQTLGVSSLSDQSISFNNFNALRPNAELCLGLGWGMYSTRKFYHFDVSATYDFNVFWSQNMIGYLADMTEDGLGGAASSLFLHGLTATARFDF